MGKSNGYPAEPFRNSRACGPGTLCSWLQRVLTTVTWSVPAFLLNKPSVGAQVPVAWLHSNRDTREGRAHPLGRAYCFGIRVTFWAIQMEIQVTQ